MRRCRLSLNIIKVLAHSRWGSDPSCLLNVYQSIVMSRLDYGCIIYSSARKSLLDKLNPIHHAGIRYCIGAFPTSPIESLYREAGLTSLYDRRNKFAITYSVGVLAQPGHPNHSVVYPAQNQFHNRPSITRPFGVRLQEYLDSIRIFMPIEIIPEGPCEVPPWTLHSIDIRLDLLNVQKGDMPALFFVRSFNKIIGNYPQAKIIYTDGSKTDIGVGSAFVIDGEAHSWTLEDSVSVFFAEQYAIWQSLQFISMNTSNKRYVIATDSLSVLQSLRDMYTKDPITQMIHSCIKYIKDKSCVLTFVWIPSHVGIPGNEMADRAAHSASLSNTSDVHIFKGSDIKIFLSNKIYKKTRYKKLNLSRRDLIIAHRLQIGHTALTHRHLLIGEPAPYCEFCLCPLTVNHIICQCPHYNRYRSIFSIKPNLMDNFRSTSSITNTIKFLKQIGLYNKF